MSGAVFFVIWLCLCATGLSIIVMRARRFAPTAKLDDAKTDSMQNATIFIGGVRWPGGNATIPLARLSLLSDGIRLEYRFTFFNGFRPLFWEARYADLANVQSVGNVPLLNTGIRFRDRSTGDWVIFWTNHRAQVLQTLREKGIAVDAETARFHFFHPDR